MLAEKLIRLFYNPLGIPDLGTAGEGVQATDTCNGQILDISSDFDYSWTTANHAIATVDAYGTHTGQSEGTTSTQTCAQEQIQEKWNSCPVLNYCPGGTDNVLVPTSITLTSMGTKTTYNGTNFIDCSGVNHGARWGYSYCVTYTVEDQNGNPIGGNYTAEESFQPVQSNPANQKSNNGNDAVNAVGQYYDQLAYLTTSAPAPQPGQYLIEKQMWTIKDNSTGQLFENLRTNCINFQYNDVTVKDITAGGTCP